MSPEPTRYAIAAALVACLLAPRAAWAQACCAAAGAVTPARLGLHEDALIGLRVRAAEVLGSYAPDGSYTAQPAHTSEVDFEQDLLAAVRLLERGQLSLMVPLVETYRRVPGVWAGGGGVGDVNLGARYDLVLAGQARILPGIALLAGLTLPTGKSASDATATLATDATGVGTVQGNGGLALEQVWGKWLVNLTGLVAARAPQSSQGVRETLAPQLTVMAAGAYTFDAPLTAGLCASYAVEGDATIDGASDPDSARRGLTLSAIGFWSATETVHVQGSLFLSPPVSQAGTNQTATVGLSLTALVVFM
jgi:hypothetical protein